MVFCCVPFILDHWCDKRFHERMVEDADFPLSSFPLLTLHDQVNTLNYLCLEPIFMDTVVFCVRWNCLCPLQILMSKHWQWIMSSLILTLRSATWISAHTFNVICLILSAQNYNSYPSFVVYRNFKTYLKMNVIVV